MTSRTAPRGFRSLDPNSVARLTFHGAAGEVTGSCFLLETARSRILLECGMVQGGRGAESRNRRRFPFDPREIDAVVLTHAHIDHSGLLPKLFVDGFHGAVHATQATCDLLHIMLPDSAHIHEDDAKHANRKRMRRGADPILPLYTTEDAQKTLDLLEPAPFDARIELAPDVALRFRSAGHILGASSVELWIRAEGFERKVVLSGDVGRPLDPLLRDPDPPREADLLVMESTYGGRDHRPSSASIDEFADVILSAAEEGANVLIPAFAVGRAQDLLYAIAELERAKRIPVRPVYLDSPMAIHVTELYARHPDCFQPKLESVHALEPFLLRFCRTPEESMAINEKQGVTILSASGMCDAGRVVHHLKHNLWRKGSHVVIAGFQAAGSRGRALVDGARHVHIHGEKIVVRARIHTIGGFSAHAGRSELIDWARPLVEQGAHVALVHGEPRESESLRASLAELSPHEVLVPERKDSILLQRRGAPVVLEAAN